MGTQRESRNSIGDLSYPCMSFYSSKGYPPCNGTVVQLQERNYTHHSPTLMSFAYVPMKLDANEGLETEENRPRNMHCEECSVHNLKFKYKLGLQL